MTTTATEFEIAQNAKGRPKWRLTLAPDHLTLVNADGSARFNIPRAEARAKLQISNNFLVHGVVAVRTGSTVIFRFTPPAFAALMEWLGPRTHADLVLLITRMLKGCLILGILLAGLGALRVIRPLRGQAPTDGLGELGVGLLLLAITAWGRLRPHRAIFVAMSAWLSLTAIQMAWQGHFWAKHPGWFALIIVIDVLVTLWWLQQYRAFAPSAAGDPGLTPQPATSDGSSPS